MNKLEHVLGERGLSLQCEHGLWGMDGRSSGAGPCAAVFEVTNLMYLMRPFYLLIIYLFLPKGAVYD